MKKSTSKHKTAAPRRGVSKPAGDDPAGKVDPLKEEKEARDYGRTIHNGSAGAFDATEHSHDEDDDDQDNDDFAMDR